MRKLAAVLLIGDSLLRAVATRLCAEGNHERAGSIQLAASGTLFLALATDFRSP